MPKKIKFQGGIYMRINNNLMATNASRLLSVNQADSTKSMEKLSSGLRINKAGDDAAGLSISEKMRGQIRGLNQASRNAQDGVSLVQTAEGALNQTQSILQRMRELAVQSGTATVTSVDRTALQSEFSALGSEINDISSKTKFNGITLLDGGFSGTFQTGANAGDQLTVAIGTSMTLSGLSITPASVSIGGSNVAAASNAITALDGALSSVSTMRSTLGAAQNRFEYKTKNLETTSENLQSAESRIRDVDMAKEMVNYTKTDIIQQAAQAMLSKANQSPQAVLQLLR